MPQVRIWMLLWWSLLCGGGCANPLWFDPVGSRGFHQASTSSERSTHQASALESAGPANEAGEIESRLSQLQRTDPQRYEAAREILRITDEDEADSHQAMIDRQVMALVDQIVGSQSPQPGGDATQMAPPQQKAAAVAPALVTLPAQARPVAAAPIATSPEAIAPHAGAAAAHLAPHGVKEPPPALPTAAPSTPPITDSSGAETPLPTATDTGKVEATAVEEEPDWTTILPSLIDALENELAENPHAERAVQQQVLLRLLYLIADRRDDAVTPVDQLHSDDREFYKHTIYGLMVWLDRDERHATSRRAALALRELRTALNHLANQSTLDVRNLALCQAVDNYGNYTEFKPATFSAGDEVVLYVEVENFSSEQVGERFETELQGEYAIRNVRGERVASVVLPLDLQQCNNRRRDYFIAYLFRLPDDLSAGEYSLELTLEDVKGKKSNQATVDFRIR